MKKPSVAQVLATAAAAGLIAASALFVKPHEGKVNQTYLDPIGIPTSCFGHVGPENAPGRTFTDAQCDKLLERDLFAASEAVRRCIRIKLTPGQSVALTSFAFNVGADKLCRSTLAKLANAGERKEKWCAELDRWVYADGKRFAGLVKRRAEEKELCLL